MNKEKYVFAQLISFLNENKFRRIVDKYQGNRYIIHFFYPNSLYFKLTDKNPPLNYSIILINNH